MNTAFDVNNRPHAIALGFVLYLPEPTLLSRLKVACDAGFAVYVFDNSPHCGEVREFCKTMPGCHYATTGKNIGLGIGISTVCAQAYYDGHRALLFFDQDTVFTTETLIFIDKFYAEHRHLESDHSAIVFNARAFHDSSATNGRQLRQVLMAISSGSLFFLDNLRRMNWHNEHYFVDCVDYEFCLNSSNHKLKIGEWSTTPGFDHVSEQPDRRYRLFGRSWSVRKYSASRVRDTLGASLRLMGTSLRTGNLQFLAAMARSLSIYVCFQAWIRMMDVFKTRERTAK